jgi:hypothetical protein
MDYDAVGGLGAMFGGMMFLVYVAIWAFWVVCGWKIYTKAGKPGWAAIVPIYNIIVLLEIVGRPLWWVVLFFVPVANIIMAFLINVELAKSFGHDIVFGIGLTLLPLIFLAVLAFGSAAYRGPVVPAAAGVA